MLSALIGSLEVCFMLLLFLALVNPDALIHLGGVTAVVMWYLFFFPIVCHVVRLSVSSGYVLKWDQILGGTRTHNPFAYCSSHRCGWVGEICAPTSPGGG